ncbi:MAG: DUF2029 domain-containing protein [Lachnospiraceae bacterium]|nr:DUF2029 domain-containing protein [Lachnospiraceae bacterium]
MKQTNQKRFSITEGNLKWWDYVLFALVAAVCFFCFQQRDLLHTTGCSVGYLNGHFRDFYDYCGTYDIHPSYMPTVYLLFAVWNIPMKLLGFLTVPTEDITLTATMWSKALPCLVYLLSGYLIYKICMEIGMGRKKSKYCVYACLTMPIAVYDQFIFGQYDIFMTACVLLGLYYYLKKKDIWFIFWFAIAVTFKYTALVIFLPMLLLRQKNVWKVVGSCILLVLPLALEFLLYRSSPGFSSYAFGVGSSGDNPTGYLFSAGIYTGFALSAQEYNVSLIVLAYGLIMGTAYFTRPADDKEQVKWVFYLSCLTFFVLFGLTKWHPQWLLFAVPFWVISSFLHRDTKIFLIIDLLFMVFFVMFIVQMVPDNVDQAMINKGVLGGLVNGDIGTKLTMEDLLGRLDRSLCLSLISMIMLVYAFFKHPKYCLNDFTALPECMGWMRTRFFCGVGFFVIPAFLCLAAALRSPYPGYQVKYAGDERVEMAVLDEIGDQISQRFCSTGTTLEEIHFNVFVNNRINKGHLKLTLKKCAQKEGEEDQILYEEAWMTDSWYDGKRIKCSLGGMAVEEGAYYEVVLEILGARSDMLLSIPYYNENVTGNKEEFAAVDNRKRDYQMVMTVYQE